MTSPAPGRSVARTSGILAGSRLAQLASGLVMAVLIASSLGAAGLGAYVTAWAFYSLIALAGQAGAREYVVRELSRNPSLTARYTVHLSVLGAGVSLVLMGGGVAAVHLIGYSPTVELSISIVLLAILPKILNTVQEAVFLAHGRVEFEALTRAAAFLIYVAAGAALLHLGYGVPEVLAGFVACEFLVAGVYFVLISWRIARLRLSFQRSLAARLYREIRSYAASAVLQAVFSRPEIIILSIFATESEVGLYGAAARIADMPLVLSEVFLSSAFPLLSRAFGTDEAHFAELQRTALRVVLAFALPVAALLFAGGEDLLRLLFGSEFAEAAPVLRLLALNVVAWSLIGLAWRSVVARGHQRLNVQLQIVTVTTRLVAGVALVVPFAAVGAAAASVASSTLHWLLLRRATQRIGAPVTIPASVLRLVVAAAAAGGVVAAAVTVVPIPLALAVGAVAYVALAFITRAVTAEDRGLISRMRGSSGVPALSEEASVAPAKG